MKVFDTFIHRWLRVPYTLHVEVKRAKKSRATVLFIHGIGNSMKSWDEVVKKMPNDMTIIRVDLLGFGKSPRPRWAKYNATTQANSLLATLLSLRLRQPLIVVGHSLGSLVAVELARRYPLLVRSLILCSPPFYLPDGPHPRRGRMDRFLRKTFTLITQHPEKFVALAGYAMKYKLASKAFVLTKENASSYLATLRATIINQRAYQDAQKLKKPIRIIRGRFDVLVIFANIKQLALENPRVSYASIVAGHEIEGLYVPAVIREIETAASNVGRKRSSTV